MKVRLRRNTNSYINLVLGDLLIMGTTLLISMLQVVTKYRLNVKTELQTQIYIVLAIMYISI